MRTKILAIALLALSALVAGVAGGQNANPILGVHPEPPFQFIFDENFWDLPDSERLARYQEITNAVFSTEILDSIKIRDYVLGEEFDMGKPYPLIAMTDPNPTVLVKLSGAGNVGELWRFSRVWEFFAQDNPSVNLRFFLQCPDNTESEVVNTAVATWLFNTRMNLPGTPDDFDKIFGILKYGGSTEDGSAIWEPTIDRSDPFQIAQMIFDWVSSNGWASRVWPSYPVFFFFPNGSGWRTPVVLDVTSQVTIRDCVGGFPALRDLYREIRANDGHAPERGPSEYEIAYGQCLANAVRAAIHTVE